VKDATRAIVLARGDVALVSQVLDRPVEDIWAEFLDDESDIAPMMRKQILARMYTILDSLEDALVDRVDELGPYELVKAHESVAHGIRDLMEAQKGQQPGGTTNNNLFLMDGDEANVRLAQRMGII